MLKNLHVIVGLGATGLSCAHYFKKNNINFAVTDNRLSPPQLEIFKKEFNDIFLSLGQLDEILLDQASYIILSPGLSLKEPAIQRQMARGVPVIGDIEIFARHAKAPIIAITGTNAKSTVTTLVYEMAKNSGMNVKVGGNLGKPALDLLSEAADLYVIELSSYQLETTHSLKPYVASILNITPDHMDRYDSFADYVKAKKNIYQNCQYAICNRDDPLTDCGDMFETNKIYFTENQPQKNEFGLLNKNGINYLAHGAHALMPVNELSILGKHHQMNALAALSIGFAFGLPLEAMLHTLKVFKGLPHRCQLIRERHGVYWYNDSKGTNVGATLAAIEGLGHIIKGKLILIAGGVGKNADFSPLILPIEKYVKAVVLIGEAATDIANVVKNGTDVKFAKTLEEAVTVAANLAATNDCVLLSPACASFDMFKNFEHRGNIFMDLVNTLPS